MGKGMHGQSGPSRSGHGFHLRVAAAEFETPDPGEGAFVPAIGFWVHLCVQRAVEREQLGWYVIWLHLGIFLVGLTNRKAGTAVTWTNMDEEPHTVVDGAQGIRSPVMGNQGSTYTHVFTTPGTYNYNCSIHPFMHGMVVVTA
jgi:hypothetical protein